MYDIVEGCGKFYKRRRGVFMTTAQLRIAYDGEALRDGSMDVRELAPALLAIGELCQESNKRLNGEEAKISVNVKTDFSKGSFVVDLDIIQTLAEQTKVFIFGAKTVPPAELLQFLGFAIGGTTTGIVGLIKFMLWLKGRKNIETTTLENGNIKVQIQEKNESIEIKPEIRELYKDKNVRKSMQGIIKPLEEKGIDEFKILDKTKTVQSITKDQISCFEEPIVEVEETIIQEDEFTSMFEVIQLSFDEKYKWRLSDGNAVFTADIEDKNFIGKIQRREYKFGKGDVITAKIRKTSWQTDKGMKTEYKIIEVLDIEEGPEQHPLF